MSLISLSDKIYIRCAESDTRLAALKKELTFRNPVYDRLKKHNRWMGGTEEFVRLVGSSTLPGDVSRWAYTAPRGAIDVVRRLFPGEAVRDESVYHALIAHRSRRIELRPYQIEARDALFDARSGYACLPCGSGKTVIGTSAIAIGEVESCVLVHTTELLHQWQMAIFAMTAEAPMIIHFLLFRLPHR